VRRVVAEELRPVKEALARIGTAATLPSSPGGSSAISSMRERMRQRRAR
jgi:hypothetical protein